MLSQQFILVLEPHRDALYGAAVSSAGGPGAEALLQRHAREILTQLLANPSLDAVKLMHERLAPPQPTAETPMPADAWARLAAAIQLAAVQTPAAVPPESGLLKPDPMLAPKKRQHRPVENDAFDLSSPMRLALIAGIVLAAGILATLYVVFWR